MSLDLTKKVQTRNGAEVIIYCTDAPVDYPIHGRIDGLPNPQCWDKHGKYNKYSNETCNLDLINVPEAPKPPTVYYRLLNEGEVKQVVDEILRRGERYFEKTCHPGDTVESDEIVRRPLKPFCVEKGLYEI